MTITRIFVETTPEKLIVRNKFSDYELEGVASMLCAKLGVTSAKKCALVKECLASLDKGIIPQSNSFEEPECNPKQETLRHSARKLIREEAIKVADEFDKKGLVDWRIRDSLIAKFRITVTKRLKKIDRRTFLSVVVTKCLDTFLAEQLSA